MKFISRAAAVLLAAVISTFYCTVSTAATEMPEVTAKGAVVINADTGEVLFRKNADKRLPMASTTKIMTTILAIEHGRLDEQFTVDSHAVKTEGSSMGLCENDKVTVRALCYGMMLPSGNDAANCTAVRVSGSVESFVGTRRRSSSGFQIRILSRPRGLTTTPTSIIPPRRIWQS